MIVSTRHTTAAALAIVLLLTTVLVTTTRAQDDDPADPGPIPGELGAPQPGKRLYDMANLLDNGQEWQVERDAARLAGHGIPNVVIIQASAMSPAEASTFANDIRQAWDVGSSPGADDGLVLLVTVDPSGETGSFPVLSWGRNALPHFGVDNDTSAQVGTEWVEPYLRSGDIYGAVDYGLRRLIYHTIYDPPPPAPLSPRQETVASVLTIVAPLIAAGFLAASIARWRQPRGQQAGTVWAIVSVWILPVVTIAIAALAVWSQSDWASLSALVLLATTAAEWVRRDPNRQLESHQSMHLAGSSGVRS